MVLEAHIVTAALKHFGMESLTDQPTEEFLTALQACGNEEKGVFFLQQIVTMLKRIIHPLTQCDSSSQLTSDGVYNYSKELLTLCMFHAEYVDAIREGDGYRILRLWKFLLILFKTTQRKNYAIEALNFLAQYNILTTPRQREQLLWSRFVNTLGRPGTNIAADLHMEHLNRTVKSAIGKEMSNLTPKVIERVGKCAGPLTNICGQFDKISSLVTPSGRHNKASHQDDLERIVAIIMKAKVLDHIPNRGHHCFKSLNGRPFSGLDYEALFKWAGDRLKMSGIRLSKATISS